MSNIYIQEPATYGKVLLETSVGDIDIELWSKEAPKACRNFVQLCLEGYYDKTIFHRVVPDFIVQGGDPTGTGQGGESVYGKPFKDEFHSRLRFVRRGLVAMANAGPNDNGSQFFFTMASTPELQNKHTIFGKVTGDTVFNILRLQECEIGANERPLYPHKILKTKVLSNPFDDIIPRWTSKNKNEEEKKVKSKSRATKNFKLLSFGEEAQEDEEETNIVTKDMRGKSKSSHDLANDPRLSSVPALEVDHGKQDNTGQKRKELEGDVSSGEEEQNQEPMEAEKEDMMEQVQKKLKKNVENMPSSNKSEEEEKEEPKQKTSRRDELREEAEKLKREIRDSKKRAKQTTKDIKEEEVKYESTPKNDALAEYQKETQKYKDMRNQQAKKGPEREEMTLNLLAKFQAKLHAAKSLVEEEKAETKDGEEEEDDGDLSWMRHKLTFEEHNKKVIDANINDLDRYEIYDPRNPLTKRRREASKQSMKDKR
ncbi:hypothetical protein CHS0354_011620 [Potamilus streckersoni]|uniref:Spliceosome-associated protein CWC27 homolog n=1 Tax=Potamilus streckersoni TaxID=2493646 RepID=A0AAE0TK48_9BIVA|nr:hypothetical protein CHS0354_011620 [Potamilus streckersoni]